MVHEFQIAQRKELKRWGRATERDKKGEVHRQPYKDWSAKDEACPRNVGLVLVVTNISRDKRQFQIRPHGLKADNDGGAISFEGWGISKGPLFISSYEDLEVCGEWSCFVSRVR